MRVCVYVCLYLYPAYVPYLYNTLSVQLHDLITLFTLHTSAGKVLSLKKKTKKKTVQDKPGRTMQKRRVVAGFIPALVMSLAPVRSGAELLSSLAYAKLAPHQRLFLLRVCSYDQTGLSF